MNFFRLIFFFGVRGFLLNVPFREILGTAVLNVPPFHLFVGGFMPKLFPGKILVFGAEHFFYLAPHVFFLREYHSSHTRLLLTETFTHGITFFAVCNNITAITFFIINTVAVLFGALLFIVHDEPQWIPVLVIEYTWALDNMRHNRP